VIISSTQALRQYLALLQKWLWLIVLGTLLAGGTALVVSLNSTSIYEATATLLITPGDTPSISTKVVPDE